MVTFEHLSGDVWGAGRVALLGDAAHAFTPNMGQGAAMAIEDALVLANELTSGAAVGEAIARYGEGRRARVRSVAVRSNRFGWLAQAESAPLAALRNVVTWATPAWVGARVEAELVDGRP